MSKEYSCEGQISLFDWSPEAQPEPEIGAWIKECGAVICHIMIPGYIGQKVAIDKSTHTHRWYRVGRLERYFEHEGHMRAVVDVGEHQKQLVDLWPGINLHEPLPWDAYPERNKAIGYRRQSDAP